MAINFGQYKRHTLYDFKLLCLKELKLKSTPVLILAFSSAKG